MRELFERVIICIVLMVVAFVAGWEVCALYRDAAAAKAEAEQREAYERRKAFQLMQVRQAIADSKTKEAREFFQRLQRAIETDFKSDDSSVN